MRSNVKPLSPADVESAHAAAQCVVKTHQRLVEFLKAGQTLIEVDRFVATTLADLKCKSCFLGYRVPRSPAFPSHACLSVNECVVHGTATCRREPLRSGDILKVDIGVTHHGWIGDAAWTYAIEGTDEETLRLMHCGKESLRLGIEELQPGRPLMDWARAVQRHAERECGFHLVRGLGGHGYGKKLHTPPFVSNVLPTFPGEWPDAMTTCRPGLLLAVEPMVAAGTSEVTQFKGEWPIKTADDSMSVHYEHDVLVDDDGPRVLTHGLDDLPDVVGL